MPLLHIVLHEPQIPNNTGNIGRTCVATGCALHLIHPLGFDTSVKACRRAGLDYWPRLRPIEHPSFDGYLDRTRPTSLWVLSARAPRTVFQAEFHPGDHLLFGKETEGLPESILRRYPDHLVTLPMIPGERSLNVATAVCGAIYVALGQMLARGEVALSPSGRLRIETVES